MEKITRTMISLVVLLVLIILSYILLVNVEILSPSYIILLQYLSYLLFFLGMFLSCWFNRCRIFFISLILALSQYGVIYFSYGGSENIWQSDGIHSILAVLIPINILIFSLLKDRGILTSWGITRMALIGIQILFVLWVMWTEDNGIIQLLNRPLISIKFAEFDSFSQISVFSFLTAFLCLFIRHMLNRSPVDRSCMGVLMAVAAGLYMREDNMAIPIFFAAAGILLVIAVIEVSYSMAYLDELTGIPSRRALKEDMMKLGGRYVVAMTDVDFFKKFNDTYGHDAGDEVLKLVASCLKQVTGGGKAYRYGGEEFTILFPNKKLQEVLPHLEQLREKVSRREYLYKKTSSNKGKKKELAAYKKLSVTISIGVAEKKEDHIFFDDVIKAADAALYRAKNKGRNCVSR